MADEKNNNENNEQKKSTMTDQVKKAGKSGAKKALKHLLKFLIPVIPILLIAMLFYALISLVVDFFQGLFEDIANFFTINLENGAYEIKDEEVDKVLEQLREQYDLSAEDLGLLGDIDYENASEEEIKEAERKYIKLFLEAQQTTQTINTGVLGSNGSVYMMTPKISETTVTKYPDYSILWDASNPIISREDFIKAVEDYTPPNGRGESNRSYRECYEKFFRNNAGEFYDISTAAGINPMVMVAIGTHESEYGTSNIANEKLNLWGWGAYDSSPGESAIDFSSEEIKEGISKGIEEVATSLKQEWTTPGTWRYERITNEGRNPTTLDGIGPLYASDTGWSDKVKQHMLNIFGDKCKLGDSLGKYAILEHEQELESMIFKKKEDFEAIVEKGGSFNELRKYYSIDESGKLMLINFNYTNGTPNLTIQHIDYKSMISQYTTSCMFFVDTAMAVQNPKFMEAFVEMVKDSRITLNVMYNSSSQTTTTTTYHYEEKTVGNETVQELVSDTTVTTQESYTPSIMISTAKTWIFSREAGFKQTNLGPTYSHSDTGSGVDRVIVDIESSGITYSEDTPKEEYNGGEKGEEGTFVGLLDKRFRIPNSMNTRSAGPDLVSNAVAYFEFLSRSSTTQAMENIMRYVLYKYTGKSYGVTEFNLSLFVQSNFSSATSSQLLVEYIHYWENGSGAPMNADGTKYIIHDDGMGHPTVGYGIDIFNGGYADLFIASGYPTEIGGEVDKDFVDSLEKQEIKSQSDDIRAATSGLGLKEYQINALVSRAYNCGTSGAITVKRGSPALNFVQSYQKYWNAETDDLFEAQDKNANFNHSLYTQYMSKPTTSDGQHLEGLERRRKSEWTLFQTGYYDVLNKWHAEGGAIIEIADMIHKYMEENNYTYCVYGGNSYEECGKYGKTHGLNATFEASKTGYHNSCCATYVSWVLQEAGYISDSEHLDGANNLRSLLLSKGFKKIDNVSELQPGDILCYSGHIEIYAGDGTVYNAGSGNAIRSSSPQNKGLSGLLFGLRAP